METSTSIQTYYKRIIDLIIEQGHSDFSNATAGHCMKITGFGSNELEYLWERLISSYPSIDTFIIAEESKGNKYISATKLIEYRNKQERPLLVLIPSNSRTAAEDSYGNATFKEFALEGIEKSLLTRLLSECPIEYKTVIEEDIFGYLSNENLSQTNKINYLLDLHEKGYNSDNFGDLLFHLNLIPDSDLLKEKAKVRPRLSFNVQSIKTLSSFSKPIYDRIAELPLEPNSIQRSIVDFLKNESDAKSAEALTELIYTSYSHLNFCNWPIPEIDPKDVKLFIDFIKSSNFKIEEGDKVLHAESDKISKVKIRLKTTPKPKDVPELKYFKVVLMSVDGGQAEEVLTLRKLKNTTAQSSFRDATVELHSNLIEEGTYFFRILAEDEYGTVLNSDDDLYDEKAQNAWENAKKENKDVLKSSFGTKYTSDSENFYFAVTEVAPNTEEQRKDKVYNILQAFFRFRLDNLKNDQELTMPSPSDSSNVWLNDSKPKHISTFYINYSPKDNYQINLSTKLRAIEDCILNNYSSFGYVDATIDNNSASLGLLSIDFKESKLTDIIPGEIKELRSSIFKRIQESNSSKNGVFETADLFNYIDEIKAYIISFTAWTTQLKSKLTNEELAPEEHEELKGFLAQLQFTDIVRVRTKLPDGKDIVACLLSPLHPLRLSWFIQLYEVFTEWEEKTKAYDNYKQDWGKNLELYSRELYSPRTILWLSLTLSHINTIIILAN
ncbi:hypothetical protein [Pontibacter sp. BAB1700]|uniref:methylation-associated defense system ATP-binding protein MAD8 n=1 Tax=Pontibacter sp. BAB1700 TaxID=1144253 RepID=UPI0002E2387B|nr:hypothetical protein [Pontibacter sp. BAB1700]